MILNISFALSCQLPAGYFFTFSQPIIFKITAGIGTKIFFCRRA